MAGPLLLLGFGLWLLLQATAGGLAGRLLSRRQTAAGASPADLGALAGAAGKAFGSGPSKPGKTLGRPGTMTTWNGTTLTAAAMPSWQAMVAAAAAQGVALAGSGWRSDAEQARLRTENGCPDIDVSPASTCRIPTARPGESPHGRGVAVDITMPGGAGDPRFTWLRANAGRYGWVNPPWAAGVEPWHWERA